MRIIRNIGYIERRQRRTRWLVGAGVVLLAFAVVAPLVFRDSTMVLLAYGSLIVGFLLFINGTQQYSKWRRRPRIDEALDQALGRLNDRYAVIHYAALGANAPEHILVSPGGVFVITPRDVGGRVRVDGRRWRQNRVFLLRFFNLGAPSLGNPTVENELQLDRLEEIFDEQTLPGELEGVVVFMAPDVEIEMKDAESTVLHISEMYDFMREAGSDIQLGNDERNEIVEALSVGDRLDISGAKPSRSRKRIKVAGS